MANRRSYRKKVDQSIVAVQLSLDTKGFTYRKWGAEQRCKPGDWIVNNQGDIYSIDKDVFAETYCLKNPDHSGIYIKPTILWAKRATQSGKVITKEGISYYQAGDYIISDEEDGTDAFVISESKFESMYEPVDAS